MVNSQDFKVATEANARGAQIACHNAKIQALCSGLTGCDACSSP
jgi:hypothetical protein